MRTSAFGLVVAAVAATMLALPGVTSAQVSAQDSVVAFGDSGPFTNLDINVTSGPNGENPTGHAFVSIGSDRFISASITCLEVNGNTAVVGGTLEPNPFGIVGFLETLVDNGPAGSGLDTFAAQVATSPPTVCPPPFSGGAAPLLGGDIVIVDAPPLPTSKDQCKNGGWKSFGVFNNQGDCISFVATGGKNPPAKKAG